MVYTVFYKTSSFAGYCFLDKNSIHPKRYGVFSFKAFKAVLVKIQICSFIVSKYVSVKHVAASWKAADENSTALLKSSIPYFQKPRFLRFYCHTHLPVFHKML